MAALATPPLETTAPATPAAAAPTPAPPTQSAHSKFDRYQNSLQDAFNDAAKQIPALMNEPAAPAPPAAPAAPAEPTAAPVAPETALAVEPAAPSIDNLLEELDFDAPPVEPVVDPTKPLDPTGLPTDGVSTQVKIPDATLLQQVTESFEKGETPEKIEELFLKTSQGRQMITARKTFRELAKPPDQGGIGHVPTIDEIREADSARLQVKAMEHEFANAPKSFVSNLFTINPETGKAWLGDPNHVASVLQTIPQVLYEMADSTKSPVYANLVATYSAPMFQRFFNFQYNQALQMPQSNDNEIMDKARMLDALQLTEQRVFGQARPLNLGPQNGNGHAPAAPSPELETLRNQVQQYQNYFQQTQNAQIQNVQTSIQTQADTAAATDVAKLFEASKVDKAYPESVLNSVKNDMVSEVKNSLRTQDPGGYQTYEIQVRDAQAGRLDPKVPVETFQRLFRNTLRQNPAVRTRLNDLVTNARERSDNRSSSLASAQTRTEPMGGGTAAPSSVLPVAKLQQQPGESKADFYARRLNADPVVQAVQQGAPAGR